jgi:spore coat polysaccharide biosynthesis protein SpsF
LTRVGIITQVRTTSSRLPGKVLIEIGGRRVLDHHLDRLEPTGLPVVVATTVNSADDPVVDIAAARGLACCRGSEDDVLSRFYSCAEANELEALVRVTSDCPLIDPGVITSGVDTYLSQDDPLCYVSNGMQRTFPRGLDFEVLSFRALSLAHQQATEPADREHVTTYLKNNAASGVRLHNVTWPVDKSMYRITLDTADDLTLIRALIEEYDAARLDCAGIIAVLDAHPELAALNAHVEQKQHGE